MSAEYELDAMALVGALVAGDPEGARQIAYASENPAELAVFVATIAKGLLVGWSEKLARPVETIWQEFSAMTTEHYA